MNQVVLCAYHIKLSKNHNTFKFLLPWVTVCKNYRNPQWTTTKLMFVSGQAPLPASGPADPKTLSCCGVRHHATVSNPVTHPVPWWVMQSQILTLIFLELTPQSDPVPDWSLSAANFGLVWRSNPGSGKVGVLSTRPPCRLIRSQSLHDSDALINNNCFGFRNSDMTTWHRFW